MIMRTTHLGAVAASLVLAGCANNADFRQLSATNAAITNDYRAQLKKFAEGQTAINADNEGRLRNLEVLQAERDTEVAQRTLALEVADDKPSLAIVRLLAAQRAPQVMAESRALKSLQPPPAVQTVAFDAGQVEALTRKLKELSVEPEFWGQLMTGLAYAQELQDEYAKSLETASVEKPAAVAAAPVAPGVPAGPPDDQTPAAAAKAKIEAMVTEAAGQAGASK